LSRTLALGTVARNESVARDTVILHVDIQLEQRPRAGQFAMVHPLIPECLLARPLSILDYADGRMQLLVKEAGVGTRAMCEMSLGASMRVFGPLGRSFDQPEVRSSPLILVAGGVGLVPLHLLARELAEEGKAAPTRLFGARTPNDLPMSLLQSGWELWVEDRAGDDHREGLVTAGLVQALERSPDAVVVTCGPTPMMKAVAAICRPRGQSLWFCLEEQMGCGAGVCRACIVPAADEKAMRTVCNDGPVFHMDEIAYA